MVCVSSLVWMTIGIGAAGGCGIVALLASSGVPLLGSLVWGGVFTAFFLMLVSPRPFRRLVGLTGVGGCAFAQVWQPMDRRASSRQSLPAVCWGCAC